MADCSGCPYLKQEGDRALCMMRGDEPLDQASYTKETCEHYQAFLKTQPSAEAEEEDTKKKKKKKRGSGGTGCLVALLIAAILMFLCVLALIALTLFFGDSLPVQAG